MLVLVVSFEEHERHRGSGLRDHAHGAVDDGVLHEAFAGERLVIARGPNRATERFEHDQRAGRAGLRLVAGRAAGIDRPGQRPASVSRIRGIQGLSLFLSPSLGAAGIG